MSAEKEMTILTGVSLITCMVQKGKGEEVVAAARSAGAQGASIHYGRGAGVRERLGLLSITVEAEKEVIQIMVSRQQEEEVFAEMFEAGQLDTPGMGIMFVTPLDKAAAYIPPSVMERIEKDRVVAKNKRQEIL
ncbi:MAG: P-II family nitrogen regulator [Hydrogenovibrio sp.]|uniref:P-II family nitrogen regulator n=1 Tax=Hydrogenovibrio sp. TaxID=2065821 RepID=UPI00286FB048|nr:P-II family nitrogen regulator [Hydrogenovibrio sp.]MDR9499854.1 P-II family nitrogen regulator [Hydrogenovibrio sp.]